jgi:hypothetical protein
VSCESRWRRPRRGRITPTTQLALCLRFAMI